MAATDHQELVLMFKNIRSPEAQKSYLEYLQQNGGIKNVVLGQNERWKDGEHISFFKSLLNLATNYSEGAKFVFDYMVGQATPEESQFFAQAFTEKDQRFLWPFFLVNCLTSLQKAPEADKAKYFMENVTRADNVFSVINRICLGGFFSESHTPYEESAENTPQQKYDEWIYLFIHGVLEKKLLDVINYDPETVETLSTKYKMGNATNSALVKLLMLVSSSESESPATAKYSSLEDILNMPESGKLLETHKNLLVFLFTLLQKTVDQKIHYSVILEIETTHLDKDDFYAEQKKESLNGIRISRADVDFIIDTFIKSSDSFMKLPVATESTNTLMLSHLLLRLLIPVSFLGGYNSEAQKLLFPEVLGTAVNLLEFVRQKYYFPQVEILPDASFELNTNTVRLVGNIVHVNKPAQNYLLENKLIPYLVCYMSPDKNNPLSREATIVFLRYMAESNPAAADYIQSLKVYDLYEGKNKFYSKMDFM